MDVRKRQPLGVELVKRGVVMKKKVVVASIIVLIVAILIGLLYINKVHSTDSYKFKKEYEKLNNQKNESGKTK